MKVRITYLAICLIVATSVQADTSYIYIGGGGYQIIDYSVPAFTHVLVDYMQPNAFTTVEVTSSSSWSPDSSIHAREQSSVIVNGATMSGLYAMQNASVFVNDGKHWNPSGVAWGLSLGGYSSATIQDGWHEFMSSGHSTVTVNGGTIFDARVTEYSSVDFFGGITPNVLTVEGNASVTLYGS